MPATDLWPPDIISLELVPYLEAWELQMRLHRELVAGKRRGSLLLLEHPPVLTLGKHGDPAFVLAAQEQLAAQGVELIRSDRGGEVTAHMPGQLVIYPILPLQQLRLAPKLYVEMLLKTVILTLRDFGIEAYSDTEHPGVWVGTSKICAVGVRIRERVSLHGLALNINNQLDLYQSIVACGLRNRDVCSMQTFLARAPARSLVEAKFVEHFLQVFALNEARLPQEEGERL